MELGLEVELFRLVAVVLFRVRDRDERRHLVVVVEQPCTFTPPLVLL
jgi:hypothetical protein